MKCGKLELEKRTVIIVGIVAAVVVTVAIVVTVVMLTTTYKSKDPRIRTDYCRKGLCKAGKGKHIGCNHNDKFDRSCKDPKMIDITPERQKALVDKHNELRSLIASGGVPDPKYDSAKRMQKLVWDDELAYLAELNAKQCVMKHDPCRATDRFLHSGQNLAIVGRTSDIDIDAEIVDMVQKWFNENADATQADIDIYPGHRIPEIGHFTQMVTDKSAFVGCGASIYGHKINGKEGKHLLLACNYSYTNMKTQPIYKKGPVCSECVTECDKTYPGLCSGDEQVPPIPD